MNALFYVVFQHIDMEGVFGPINGRTKEETMAWKELVDAGVQKDSKPIQECNIKILELKIDSSIEITTMSPK